MATLVDRVLRRVGDCDAVGGLLPAWVAGEAELDRRAQDHVAQCLRCQADVARYRRLLRTLHALRPPGDQPAPEVLSDILSALDGRGRAHWSPAPWVAIGVAGAAGAVGAAGVLLWTVRRRPSVLSG
ncbi:MAG: anti-sigma factor family protein [Acidimicrobiales bacterium]